MANIKEAVTYERQVSFKQGDISLQKQDCDEIAEKNGFKIVKRYGDNGGSGASMNRQGLCEMLAYIKEQDQPVAVVASDLSRLSRNSSDLLRIYQSIAGAGSVLVTKAGEYTPNIEQEKLGSAISEAIKTLEGANIDLQ